MTVYHDNQMTIAAHCHSAASLKNNYVERELDIVIFFLIFTYYLW